MLSGGELIIVVMAVVALLAMTCSAAVGVLTRLVRGKVRTRSRRDDVDEPPMR